MQMESFKPDLYMSERVTIGGKSYIQSTGKKEIAEMTKDKGSFINILANSLQTGKNPNKTMNAWR